jgi:hypothetical protein
MLAGSAEHDFKLSNSPFAEGRVRQAGGIEPLDIFDDAAMVTYKVMMAVQIGIKQSGASVERNFAHQAGFGESVQAVVHGGAGCPRIRAVDGLEDLVGSRVDVASQEVLHDAETLGSEADVAGFKGAFDLFPFIHRLKLDYV